MLQSLGLGKFPLSDGHWNEPGDVVVVVVGAIVVVSVVVVMGSAVGAIVVVVTVGSELVFGSPIVHSGELNGQSQAKEIVLKTRPFGQN